MELSGLQIAVVTVIAVLSVIGVALFARTVGHLVRVIRVGRPDPTRGGQAGARAYSLFAESLGHARLGRWPLVGIMHWLVFVGFGALFFTLVTAYGQVVDPEFALPLVGHWVVLRVGHRGHRLADPASRSSLLIAIRQKTHPRSAAGADGRRSRFFGSYVLAGLLRRVHDRRASRSASSRCAGWSTPSARRCGGDERARRGALPADVLDRRPRSPALAPARSRTRSSSSPR